MTLENQSLHLESESLRTEAAGLKAEVERVAAERDALIEVARELIESAGENDGYTGPTEAAVVDGGPFDRLKALVAEILAKQSALASNTSD